MSERRVPTVLGKVRIDVQGDGPALLLWPSLLMTGALWRAQVQRFRQTHTTIAVDPPGHGGSDRLHAPFTFAACTLVIDQLLDAVGADQAHLVGNSWGAMIGATYAATRPQRTLSATLMNGTAAVAPLRQRLEYGALVRACALGNVVKPVMQQAARDAFLGPTSLRERPHAVEGVREAVAQADPRSVRWAVRSVVPQRPDQHALLRRITAPTLVVAGAEDATFPVAETRRMAEAIPGARFEVVAGAAHLAAMEVPDVVNDLLAQHLRGAGGGTSGSGLHDAAVSAAGGSPPGSP